MPSVTLTPAMRANLASLQSIATLLGLTQERLATGNKVNSALDNPTSFFAAQGLSNRAADLSSLLDGMAQNIQALKAADKGITGLIALAEQAKAIGQTALSQASGGAFYTGTVSLTAAQQADITTGGLTAAGDKFSVQVGSGPVTTFTIAANETLQTLVQEMNTISGLSVTTVADPSNQGNVFLQVRTTNGQSVKFLNVTNTPATALFGAGVLNGGSALPATTTAPTDRVALETSYNQIRTQIDNLIKDTGYRGKNLLNGDSITVQFNETNTTSLTIVGAKRDSAGLGIAAAVFDSTANIQTRLDQIATALNTLRADASKYGTNLAVIQARQEFTTSLIATLKDGATQLTIADKNEEGANLLALQTQQQLSIQALALASQANQSVLRLFV